MAVPISVTVTMPMTMPSVVSTERILFARMAPQEMPRPSRSSVRKFMVRVEIEVEDREPMQSAYAVAFGSAFMSFVLLSSLAIRPSRMRMMRRGVPGDVFLVRDDDDGVAFPRKLLEQRHDFRAGLGIEIAGRLVGQQDGRLVDQRAGDGDALALAAGKFVGLVMNAVGQADLRQRLQRHLAPFLGGHAGINQRQLDVAQRVRSAAAG